MRTSAHPAVIECVDKVIAEVEEPAVNPDRILGRSNQPLTRLENHTAPTSRPRLRGQLPRGAQT